MIINIQKTHNEYNRHINEIKAKIKMTLYKLVFLSLFFFIISFTLYG